MKELKITIRKQGVPDYVYYSTWYPQGGDTVNFQSFANIAGQVTEVTWAHTNEVIITVN